MTITSILDELQTLGSEATQRIFRNHGIPDPVYGVKVEALKKIAKRLKNQQELGLQLYDSGVYDAMYLAGLVVNGANMTREQLQGWVEKAHCSGISEYTVPWVASEHPDGYALAKQWIESNNENIASAGWATLSCWVGIYDDNALNIQELEQLLQRVETHIAQAPDRVRYTMNGFVIALGSGVASLSDAAIATAERIGNVQVNMGKTACKVPDAVAYIKKIADRGAIGKKRKTAKCT